MWSELHSATRSSAPSLVDINALVQITEPVVADRHVIQDRRRDRPIFGDSHQPPRRVLQLVDICRSSRWNAPAAAWRVVPLAERVIEVRRQAVLRVENLIALHAENMLIEYRATG